MNPILASFNNKYRIIIEWYHRGMCSAQEMLEAIEIVNKYLKKN